VRRARRLQPTTPREGDLIIDARVQARLLGLRLLDIDAKIVVAPVRTPVAVAAVHSHGKTRSVNDGQHAVRRPIGISPDVPAPPDLGHAMRLIREASTLLDQAARVR
jgi:hypothetical protein